MLSFIWNMHNVFVIEYDIVVPKHNPSAMLHVQTRIRLIKVHCLLLLSSHRRTKKDACRFEQALDILQNNPPLY